MSNEPRAGQRGLWSLRQAHEVLQVPERLLRTASRAGWISSPDGLNGGDLLAIRALGAACLPGRDKDVEFARGNEIVQAAHRAWAEPDSGWTLVVTDAEARLAGDDATLAVLLRTYADRPRLLLPLGAWALDFRQPSSAGAGATR